MLCAAVVALVAATPARADTVLTSCTPAALDAAAVPIDDSAGDTRAAFWAARLDALTPVVKRGIARGELRPGTDARLLLETLIAPVHGRLLLTSEPIDDALAERLVDLVLDGAAPR